VVDDAQPHDDALASAWYRQRLLPVLVRRALDDLGGSQ
jgi:CO/xanthine dehydrogenase FAD-binding subunit